MQGPDACAIEGGPAKDSSVIHASMMDPRTPCAIGAAFDVKEERQDLIPLLGCTGHDARSPPPIGLRFQT